jgi:hypothetical protein
LAKKLDKKQTIKKIVDGAKLYDAVFKNKVFLIIYDGETFNHKGYDYKEVLFKKENFMHLTGIETKLKAKDFYKKCISGRLSEKDFIPGTETNLKLEVLPYLGNLFIGSIMIGPYNGTGIKIRYDYVVGDTRNVLCLAFKHNKHYDILQSLLNDSVKKRSYPTKRVYAVYVKDLEISNSAYELLHASKDYKEDDGQKILGEVVNNNCLNDGFAKIKEVQQPVPVT